MQLKINPLTWDEGERTGYRHVTVAHESVNLMAVLSHFTNGEWKSTVVPMGYSYDRTEIHEFIEFFKVLPKLMEFLETDSVLTYDLVQTFIQEIC